MFKNSRILTRMAMMLLGNAALLIALGTLGYFGMSSIRDGLRTVYEDRTIALGQIQSTQASYYEIRLTVADTLNATEAAIAAKSKVVADRQLANITAQWRAYLATYLTPEEAKLVQSASEHRKAYDAAWSEILTKAAGGDRAGAAAVAASAGDPAFAALSADIEQLVQLQARVAAEE